MGKEKQPSKAVRRWKIKFRLRLDEMKKKKKKKDLMRWGESNRTLRKLEAKMTQLVKG